MNENIEKVLDMLDGFRMSGEMTYSAYSALHDEISLLDDPLKEQEAAVPIEPLCRYLEVYARTPIYNMRHTAEWWKEELNGQKWEKWAAV